MAGTTISGLSHPILKNDYASEWMGIEVLALSDGHATVRMTLRQEMLNGFGMAHGGMIFAFADTAFALACNPATPAPGSETPGTETHGTETRGTETPESSGTGAPGTESSGTGAGAASATGEAADTITVASGVDINFLKPAFQGQVITAVADRRSSAGRSGLYDIQIFAADPGSPLPGELIAEFRGRSRTIPKSRNKS
jgi:acyl-CoA thioesterase